MTILEIVTGKIKSLDKGNIAATKLTFQYGHTGQAEILVPLTPNGRALLRALLVEIGCHECELADEKKEAFVTTRDMTRMQKGDLGV